jgi:hypothetical protein
MFSYAGRVSGVRGEWRRPSSCDAALALVRDFFMPNLAIAVLLLYYVANFPQTCDAPFLLAVP